MFKEVFRYELSYRLRSPVTWIYWAVIWVGTLVIVHFTSTDNGRVINTPLHHAEIVTMLDFFLIVVTAGIFGDAATRDADHGMQPMFSTAPLSKFDYLGGRFAASFLVNLALLMGLPLMVALSMSFPWLSHFNWAPFQVMSFVQPFVLLTLPNLFIAAAVLYTIGSLTKNALAMYVAGLGLGILYLIVVNNGVGNRTIEDMLDPFALTTLQRYAAYWTPSEKIERLIGFPGIVLANRALWLTIAAGMLVFLHARFSFTARGLRGRRSVQAPGSESEEPIRHAIARVPHARRDFSGRTRLAQLVEVTRHALADIARNRIFLVVVFGMLVLVFVFGWQVGAIVFDTSTWPVTHLIAGTALKFPMMVVFTVLTSLVAGELVWKEREVGASDMSATAPVPDWIPFMGRLIALMLVLALLQVVLMAAGLTIQALQGYYRFELALYVKILFGLNLLDYLIWAALAMAVHVVVNHKNLGHALVIAIWAFSLLGAPVFGVRHNLVLFNNAPDWIYSDLNGFGPFLRPWFWFKGYWAAWALLLVVFATVFWVRSTEGGLRARLRLARFRAAGAAGRAGAVASLLVLGTGGFIFYNTNVLYTYRSDAQGRERQVDYERRYKRFENAPQPTVVANTMRVEVYPDRPSAALTGSFRLVNTTGRRIDSVHVMMDSDVKLRALEFEGGSALVLNDTAYAYRIYALTTPMEPGDSLGMTYDVLHESRGFSNWGVPREVVRNGAYFDRGWLPLFGYQRGRELSDDHQRPKYGLPPQPEPASPYDTSAAARRQLDEDGASYVHSDVTIGTNADQIAVTPGKLVREWRENDRRYFRYVTREPVLFGSPVLSARYQVRGDTWRSPAGEIPLTIYYHPTHTFNLDRMTASMKATLEYLSREVGPYPFGELRIVEFPRYASFARANPHTITFSEGSAFITRIEDGDVDRPFFVIAHETAHQWWGNKLRGARIKGGAILSESMAQYSAMMVMEKTYGRDMVRRFFDFEMDRYLRGRSGSAVREVPLVEATTQRNLYYNKGGVAMYSMRDMIGEEAVNLALRRFFEKHSSGKPPYATSLDLVGELRAVTPDSLQSLVTDLFETITLWDVETDTATVERVGDRWRVDLTVTARKVRADSVGKETDVQMHDLVEIGVFGPVVDGTTLGEELYLVRHRIRSGQQKVSVMLPVRPGKPPLRAGIDPFRKLIAREPHARAVPLAQSSASSQRR